MCYNKIASQSEIVKSRPNPAEGVYLQMNSLENRLIETEVVIINMTGYQFRITDKSITRFGLKGTETSKGLLVASHFEYVFCCLYLAHLLKDCEVKEAIANYWMGEEEKKKYENAPGLDTVLNHLLKQLSLLTDGVYDEYYKDCQARHDDINEHGGDFDLPYQMQIQDIFWHILDLKEGRYHGSGNIRYEGRRGIPKIETTGEKLYSALLDLVWRMDNGPDYQSPEEIEAKRRIALHMKSVIPDVKPYNAR